jgi:hypothetical protein
MKKSKSLYHGHRFPAEVISCAVRWYSAFSCACATSRNCSRARGDRDFGPIRQHFALKRHLLRASLYRKQLAAPFVAWCELTKVTQNPSYAF